MTGGDSLFLSEARASTAAAAAAASDALVADCAPVIGGMRRFRELNNPVALALRIGTERVPDMHPPRQHDIEAKTYRGAQIAEQRQASRSDDPDDLPLLYFVFFRVPEERRAEFDAWYDQEHIPLLLKCEHWAMVRRFRLEQESGPSHLALHYIADVRAFLAPERTAARTTEWYRRISSEPWFKGSYKICLQELATNGPAAAMAAG
jgi:hypothetical protein